jgi:hypothetical protein
MIEKHKKSVNLKISKNLIFYVTERLTVVVMYVRNVRINKSFQLNQTRVRRFGTRVVPDRYCTGLLPIYYPVTSRVVFYDVANLTVKIYSIQKLKNSKECGKLNFLWFQVINKNSYICSWRLTMFIYCLNYRRCQIFAFRILFSRNF